MITIVEQGGFQYKVKEGDTIKIPLLEATSGQEITLGRVLLVSEGDSVKVGAPAVAEATVKAKVLQHGKNDKVMIMKKNRRKDYKRKKGHRQDYTQVQITSISA
jgi:large subunit ribosomal protein L21